MHKISYVVMVTVINWVPPPQSKKALDAMEVVVVGMVTAATPQQEEHTPAAEKISDTKKTYSEYSF